MLTYAYNTKYPTQPGAPFDLVLSRPPPTALYESIASKQTSVRQTNLNWLTNLRNMVESTRKNTTHRHCRYKREFEALVRNALLWPPGDLSYIREDLSLKGKHKLRSQADGPYRVVSIGTDGQSVRIRRSDHDETVNRNRLEVAPQAANPDQEDAPN